MKFDLRVPCKDCPFRKKGGIKLDPRRVEEITDNMLSSAGFTFACHQTTGVKTGKDVRQRDQTHCAGALIFAEKNKNATQMMRLAERFGWYDARKLLSNKRVLSLVFDNEEEMKRVHAS